MTPVVAIFFIFLNAGIAEATMISKDSRQSRLDFWGPILSKLALPGEAGSAEVCDFTSLLSSADSQSVRAKEPSGPAGGGGTTPPPLAAADPLSVQYDSRAVPNPTEPNAALGHIAYIENGMRLDAPNGQVVIDRQVDIDPVNFIRLRVVQIAECQRYLKYLVELIRTWMPYRNQEGLAVRFDGDTGIGAVSFASEAIELPHISSFGVGHAEIGTLIGRRDGAAQRSNSLPSAYRQYNSQTDKEKEQNNPGRIITIRQFMTEIFSSIYTYIFLSGLITMSLYLRRRI